MFRTNKKFVQTVLLKLRKTHGKLVVWWIYVTNKMLGIPFIISNLYLVLSIVAAIVSPTSVSRDRESRPLGQ